MDVKRSKCIKQIITPLDREGPQRDGCGQERVVGVAMEGVYEDNQLLWENKYLNDPSLGNLIEPQKAQTGS